MNKSQIYLWCRRKKLKPPQKILKKDLIDWVEEQYKILCEEKIKAQEQERIENQKKLEQRKLEHQRIAAINNQRKNQKEQKRLKTIKQKSDIEWEERLDAYLRHTLPMTYGNKKVDTEWRKPSKSLLDVIDSQKNK